MALKKGLKIEEPIDDFKDDPNNKMKSFSAKVAVAHTYIKSILLSVEKLSHIKDQIQTTVGSEKEKVLSRDIDEIISSVMNNQQKMKVILEQLQEGVKESKEEDKVNLIVII